MQIRRNFILKVFNSEVKHFENVLIVNEKQRVNRKMKRVRKSTHFRAI